MTRNTMNIACCLQADFPDRDQGGKRFHRTRRGRRRRSALRLHGFTLIELLVVIAIISLLVSILLPSLTKAKELASVSACAANSRSLYLAFSLYAQDTDGVLPHSRFQYPGESVLTDWFVRVRDTYLDGTARVFFCPADPDIDREAPVTYLNISIGANETGPFPWKDFQNINLFTISEPGKKAMFCDGQKRSDSSWRYVVTGYGGPDYWPSDRHFGGSNVTFCDGHVDALGWEDMYVYWTGTVTLQEAYALWCLPMKPIQNP